MFPSLPFFNYGSDPELGRGLNCPQLTFRFLHLQDGDEGREDLGFGLLHHLLVSLKHPVQDLRQGVYDFVRRAQLAESREKKQKGLELQRSSDGFGGSF